MTKTDRQLAYILLLQAGRRRTAQQLAEHFEVCKRTVYRDIQALSEAGVPIVSMPGKGYGILDTYYLSPVRLTTAEATGLYIGCQLAHRQTDASFRPDLQSAMLKVESVLPDEIQKQLGRLKSSIHLDSRNRPGAESRFLAPISRSIVEQQLLRLQYRAFSTDQLTNRDVEPLWLLYHSSHWHLIGYCRLRNDLRDFRIDRIRNLVVVNEHIPERPDLSLTQFLRQHERYRDVSEVTVKFSKPAARFAREWFHWLSFTEEDQGDCVIMRLLVERPDWICWWVLSFGAEAEVLSPEPLRQQVMEAAWKIIKLYQPTSAHPKKEPLTMTAAIPATV